MANKSESKTMLRSEKSVYAIFFAGLAVALMVIALVLNQMTALVSQSSRASMSELVEHDINYIETYIGLKQDCVAHAGASLRQFDVKTTKEAQSALAIVRDDIGFARMYLVGEDGRLYSDTGSVHFSRDDRYYRLFEENDGNFIDVVNARGLDGTKQLMLAYGVTMEPYEVKGTAFIGIIGVNPVDVIRSKVNIESFNGQGFSCLIDRQGDFIVDVDNSASLDNETNMFADLAAGDIDPDLLEEVKQAVAEKRPTEFEWTSVNGQRMLTMIAPISDNNWSFVMTAPKSVFTEQGMQLVMMTAIMLVVILAIAVIVFFVIMRSSKKRAAKEAAMEARSQFLSSLSHELRTPVVGVVAMSDLMEKNIQNTDKMTGYVSQLKSSSQYLLSLVNDVLDMSKLESGKTDYQMEPTDLKVLLEECCMLQAEVYAQRRVDLSADIELSEPWIMTDGLHFKQVVMNILGNASKFTPEGGWVKLKARQAAGQDGTVVTRVSIADNGIGMTKEFLERIWDPFAQERSTSTKTVQKGTGLGMAISHDYMVGLGGDIKVESELGKGSTFILTLPAQVAQPQKAEPADAASGDAASSQKKDLKEALSQIKVLFAEDNDMNALLLMELLEEEGIGLIVRAADGQEALDKFNASAPGEFNMVLTDVNMPGMNGFELAAAIRSSGHADAQSVLILSASANDLGEDRENAQTSGMNGCLQKPLQPERVAAAYIALTSGTTTFFM